MTPKNCARGIGPDAHNLVTMGLDWEVVIQPQCQEAVDEWRISNNAQN